MESSTEMAAHYGASVPSQTRSVFTGKTQPRRVLLVKLSSLGDVVHALPLVAALREGLGPSAFIGWAVRESLAGLLQGNPHIDAVYPLKERGLRAAAVFGAALRAEKFDVALDAQGLFLSGVVTRSSGAPVRIGFDKNREGNRLFLTHPVVPGRTRIHMVEKLLGFCDALGVPNPHLPVPAQKYLADGEAGTAAQLMGSVGDSGMPCAGFVVGTSMADKSWPIERWAEAAGSLAGHGVRVILMGGPGEEETGRAIARAAPQGAIAVDLVGKTPLRILASVLARCDVVVGGDTGPTHLAVAVGTSVVGLYGVSDPGHAGPYWGPAPSTYLDYVENEAPPEQRRLRHTTVPGALRRIPADAVVASVLKLLSESGKHTAR